MGRLEIKSRDTGNILFDFVILCIRIFKSDKLAKRARIVRQFNVQRYGGHMSTGRSTFRKGCGQ
jgi:hypothetical protein